MTDARTAVIVVHGMGEQLPLETLNKFVRSALPKVDGRRHYFSRPERITDSFEARRHLAYKQPPHGDDVVHGHTEFFEYHWSWMMAGNRLGDLVPTLLRLLFRRPATVPYGLKRAWLLVWLLMLLLVGALVALVVVAVVADWNLIGLVIGLAGEGLLVAVLLQLLNRATNPVTKSFVDVVRYLDRSPRSYAVRRDIREGMVDLLQGIHDSGRYSRVVVVAHSLGAFIAYDAIAYLWPTLCNLHAGPLDDDGDYERLPGLKELTAAARAVDAHPRDQAALTDAQQAELDRFRELQFEVWRSMRRQGNPWLVTDLISVGTPMYFADLLFTEDREEFRRLTKIAELPMCPPRAGSQTVEGDEVPIRLYGFNNRGRQVLVHGAPFAVVRWTNLFFPAERSWRGDWFGGPLRPLFGAGVLDHPITGNLPGRRTPAVAHGRYFNYPEDLGPDDMATVLQRFLALRSDHLLVPLDEVPDYLDETDRKT